MWVAETVASHVGVFGKCRLYLPPLAVVENDVLLYTPILAGWRNLASKDKAYTNVVKKMFTVTGRPSRN